MSELNNIPKHWQVKKLGEVCQTTSGGTPSRGIKSYYEGNIPWVKSGELDRGLILDTEEKISEEAVKNSSAKVFPKGTLLIALYGATIGKLAFLGVDAATNQAVCGIYKNENINSNYLYHFLFSKKPSLVKQGIGGAQPNISQGILKNLDIPIPPLPEQLVIVSKIEELLSDLENGKQQLLTAQQQLKVYRQSLLKAAFEGKLTENWRENQNHLNTSAELLAQITDLKENEANLNQKKLKPTNSLSPEEIENLPRLPKTWKWVSLGEIISDLTDYHANGSYLKMKENVQLFDTTEFAIMIRATNFEKDNFKTDLKYITEHAYNFLSRSKLFGGEILIGKIGNAGKVYFMPYLGKPASLAMNLFALRFNVAVNKYIYYHLLSLFSKQEISSYVKGVGNPTIDKNSVRSLSIALPSFNEQQQIVEILESKLTVCDKIEETISQSLLQAETLKQSILKKAFEGKLV